MDVLTSITSLKEFVLLRGREQSSKNGSTSFYVDDSLIKSWLDHVKKSLENIADVSEKLFYVASSIQNQFESNEKQCGENGLCSPSFLNEVEVGKHSMRNLIEAISSLQCEIQKLPELIETSRKKFQEEITQFYEEQLEKALSTAIETCLSISKQKIDELTSFVVTNLPEL
ncbi:unnamed protein product [Hydatigera taeniaeformis]|uniref:Uncharacterized protein n=1 Tax=Hydatigena taeniaeformis TaxID=6205 RepID=A0A0R3X6E0_HYDTA|nr:unnamed protein product [Hydatigera taeniaeformis]